MNTSSPNCKIPQDLAPVSLHVIPSVFQNFTRFHQQNINEDYIIQLAEETMATGDQESNWRELEAATAPLPEHVCRALKDPSGNIAPKTDQYSDTIVSDVTGLNLHCRTFLPTNSNGDTITPAKLAFFFARPRRSLQQILLHSVSEKGGRHPSMQIFFIYIFIMIEGFFILMCAPFTLLLGNTD